MKLYLIFLLVVLSCSGNRQKADQDIIFQTNSPSKVINLSDYDLKYNQLGVAVQSNNLEKVKQLLKNGADIEEAGKDDFNVYGALYVAVITGNENMVKFLIENKANVNPILNDEGYTLIVVAIKSGKINIVKTLINSGTKINASNDIEGNKKFIPVLETVIDNQSDIFKLLINKGADPFEKNFEGISAYDYAKVHNVSFLSFFNEREREPALIIKGVYKGDCGSKTGLIILDTENAYLDLMTLDGYVRLVMDIKNNDVFFDSVARITHLNKALDWKTVSLDKPVLRIEQLSEDKISVNWIGFYNSNIRKTEVSESPFSIKGKVSHILEKCK